MKLAARLLLLVALNAGTSAIGQEVRPATSRSPDCKVPQGWSSVAEREPRYVVLGELHGTRQGPEFIANLACALAAKGERILIAVEQSATDDAALQAAWKLPAGQFGKALSQIGWFGRDDGVASEAMFDMLVQMHDLKETGLPLGVVAFNGLKDEEQARRFADLPGQGPHEAAQAENIAQAIASGAHDRVLILVGNFHARKDRVERRGAQFDPMARRLAQMGKTITLDMRYGDGSSWNCILKPGVKPEPGKPVTAESLDCGNHATRGNADLDRPPFIELGATSSDGPAGAFDGFFWVGPIEGSQPAGRAETKIPASSPGDR